MEPVIKYYSGLEYEDFIRCIFVIEWDNNALPCVLYLTEAKGECQDDGESPVLWKYTWTIDNCQAHSQKWIEPEDIVKDYYNESDSGLKWERYE